MLKWTAFQPLYTHPFNGPLSGTTRVSRYQKGKTNLNFTGARDSEWQWHQLGMCNAAPRSRQITTPAPHHSVFLQAGCPSCRPTTASKHWRLFSTTITLKNILYNMLQQISETPTTGLQNSSSSYRKYKKILKRLYNINSNITLITCHCHNRAQQKISSKIKSMQDIGPYNHMTIVL